MDAKAIKKDFIRFMRSRRGGAPAQLPRGIAVKVAGKAPAALRPAPQQRGQGMNMPQVGAQLPVVAPPGLVGGSTPVPRPLGAPTGSQGMGSGGGLASGLERLAQLQGARSLYPPLGKGNEGF